VTESNWLQRNGYFRIGTSLLIVLGIAILFQAFGAVLVTSVDAVRGDSLKETPPIAELIATGIAQLVVMLLGTMLLVRIARQDPIRVFRLQGFEETPAMAYVLAIPIIFAAQLVGSMISVLWEHVLQHLPVIYSHIKELEKLSENVTKGAIMGKHSLLEAVLVFVTIAIVPALSEEILFRGFMQTNIEFSGKHGPRPYVAILWTSLAFAIIHFEPIELPGLFVLGLVLGWMSYRTGNLLVGSVGHVANNAAIVLVMLLLPQASEGPHSAVLSEGETSITDAATTLVIALPVLIISLVGYYRLTNSLTARNPPPGLFEHPSASEPDQHYTEDQLHL